jgi:small neutral amino acid transporter SnatA (MarC family)
MVVMAITRIVLRFIDKICKILGGTGSEVAARLMTIFIASIAVEPAIEGIRYSIP